MFCSRGCHPIDAHNFANRIWYPLLRYLELEKRRPYQTRHTTATLMLASGENPEWIARLMGHTNTQMLFTVYSRFVPNLTRQDGLAFTGLVNRKTGNAKPQTLTVAEIDALDPAAIEKERQVLTEKAKEEGRPENMIDKIVSGQIAKFQKDVVLTKQPFVMDPDVTIEQLVANSAKVLGSSDLHLAGFVRLALGEGVEKVEGPDFATEVASMMGG